MASVWALSLCQQPGRGVVYCGSSTEAGEEGITAGPNPKALQDYWLWLLSAVNHKVQSVIAWPGSLCVGVTCSCSVKGYNRDFLCPVGAGENQLTMALVDQGSLVFSLINRESLGQKNGATIIQKALLSHLVTTDVFIKQHFPVILNCGDRIYEH